MWRHVLLPEIKLGVLPTHLPFMSSAFANINSARPDREVIDLNIVASQYRKGKPISLKLFNHL